MAASARKPFALYRSLVGRYGRDLALALAVAALMVLLQLGGYFLINHQHAAKDRVDSEIMRVIELNRGLNEAQDALHRFNDSGSTAALDAFYTSLTEAETARAGLVAVGLRENFAAQWLDPRMQQLGEWWRRGIELHRSGQRDRAIRLIGAAAPERLLGDMRGRLRVVIAENQRLSGALATRNWATYAVLFWLQIGFAALMLWTLQRSVSHTRKEALARRGATAAEAMARRRLELLFQMHDMLQSAEDHKDANAILVATGAQLAPGFGGALYIFNNSGDRLQLSTTWNWDVAHDPPDTIMPGDCWALKRGKMQHNQVAEHSLRCPHAHAGAHATLEIPMVARGQVLGMLVLCDPQDTLPLAEAELIGSALADGMSLALANIALRERLRNQALRDGLTGLYNRRYMEDVLDRFVEVAKNGGPETALVMIDLDHFKAINDEHGHAAGDAILREVGAAMMASLRKADVACRYGGEELAIILPGCNLATAIERANALRARIETLSDRHGFRISASMGVATAPATAQGAAELMAAADRALYAAKAAGRNQVCASGMEAVERRGARALQDRLAAI